MRLFNRVTIRTPESVELEFSLAGIGSRAIALAIDYIVLAIGLLLLFLLGIFFLIQLEQLSSWLLTRAETFQLWVIAFVSLLMFALYVGYFVGFETWWYGQTPGKRYARIRVIRDDAQPVRLFQATLRSLVRPIDDILFLGFFCILLGQREKRIGDWLAGTLVIQTDPRTAGQEITLSERAQTIGADLLNIVDFDQFSPEDLATVREYLQRRRTLTSKAYREISMELARRLQDKAGLASLPMQMTSGDFLEAVYWAYQQRGQERPPG